MEPVIQVIDKGEGVWDVVTLWTEEQQHGQRKILRTTKHNNEHTRSDEHTWHAAVTMWLIIGCAIVI